MTEGNISAPVVLSKTTLLINRGMGMTLPQMAGKYGLSNQQMRSALIDAGIMKAETESEEKSAELTAREQKFMDVCAAYSIEFDDLTNALTDLGLEYKTGRRNTKGGKKYTIINDYQNEA